MACEPCFDFTLLLKTGQASAVHNAYISLIFWTPSVSMFALLKFDCSAAVLGIVRYKFFHPCKNVFYIHCLQVICLYLGEVYCPSFSPLYCLASAGNYIFMKTWSVLLIAFFLFKGFEPWAKLLVYIKC